MLKRIVKMSFDPKEIENFRSLFEKNREKISGFEGCNHLELLQDISKPHIFFTYSYWNDEHALDSYRNSPLFREVWAETKKLFNEKPQAWSLKEQQKKEIEN
ncbi:MAG TPA: antibiotic biosynthesis monooxygenase family protein [Salinimicrobium sp.]|nr:antibiotic biosynthesis monooxygenase family protein [Salinimicrobium sp.]